MRLFLYVFRDYLKYVLTTLVLCLFLFVLFDFIHRTTAYFPKYKPSAELVIKLYLYQLPAFAVQALPIAGLLSSVVTMVLLSRTNEVSAMRAVGMGPIRIALPLAIGGLLLSVFSIVMGELLLPKAARLLHHVQDIQIEGGNEQALAAATKWQRKDESIIHFREFDHADQTLQGLEVMALSPSFRPVRLVQADLARYSSETKVWDAEGVLVTNFNPNGTIDYTERRRSLTLELTVDPKQLKLDRRRADELSIRELKATIAKGEKSGTDTISYRVDMHAKMAYPWAAFVVSLIGLNFAFKSERTTESARGVILAFGIGISYWFVLNAVKELGRRGDVPPVFAGWFANFFILALVFFQSWKGRRAA
ncbi:MAG: LptF/LptG family permease [Proteobacteria bacterium]|nr:LptF/LptG family permease [Pseudomonadota bacterium]